MTARVGAAALMLAVLPGCSDSTQPSLVAGVRLSPEYTGAGIRETIVLEAMPLGENDQPLPDRADRVAFRVSNPSIASLEPLGDGHVAVTGVRLGNTSIVAELGRSTGSSLMFMQPPGLDRIEIQPSSGRFVRSRRPG